MESVLSLDPYLAPYLDQIRARTAVAETLRKKVIPPGKSLAEFAIAHEYFGLHKSRREWTFRERAPHAERIVLVGDFSEWRELPEFELTRKENGVWEASIPLDRIRHGEHYKLSMHWKEPWGLCAEYRIPSHARRVVQDQKTHVFSAQVWDPPTPYAWRVPDFRVPKRAPLIYETHAGIAQEEPRVGTYREFTEHVLPRIVAAGYNTIQLMAVQEHPYYGSFGYQVSNFFAPSSRFGTPEELMELVDTAHMHGIAVIMDLVHSHAVKNENEGISRFDGSYTLYFHEGAKGEHPAWNTRCFDYGKPETLHFLLSNCRYWLDAFKFDGFRFDGVTSMIYWDHGLGKVFTHYDQYFGPNVDLDAIGYLSLANELIHEVRPDAITVAEEMSGLPGLAAPRDQLGVGFDYRLAMGIPDYWIKTIKELPDEQWDVGSIWFELINRRYEEKSIGYCESHDQAFVGDKTIMFRLADKEMYWSMHKSAESLIVDRAMALHKMIRLVTLATAGHGYLAFMGNEFGHPEWIDLPRADNGWSYHYARRQWSLRDDPSLRFGDLAHFDEAMIRLAEAWNLLGGAQPVKYLEHVQDKVLAFVRQGLLFVFNFDPTRSYTDYRVPAPAGSYRVVLDSDRREFGGHGRLETATKYFTSGEHPEVSLYLPTRTALVFAKA